MKLACAALAHSPTARPALAQNVGITPVGSHPGGLCADDRAVIFEAIAGVRLLYDPVHHLALGDDPRLDIIRLVRLSHVHGNHVGALKLKALRGRHLRERHPRARAALDYRRGGRGQERGAGDHARHGGFCALRGPCHAWQRRRQHMRGRLLMPRA